jgi:hypothetical protein
MRSIVVDGRSMEDRLLLPSVLKQKAALAEYITACRNNRRVPTGLALGNAIPAAIDPQTAPA